MRAPLHAAPSSCLKTFVLRSKRSRISYTILPHQIPCERRGRRSLLWAEAAGVGGWTGWERVGGGRAANGRGPNGWVPGRWQADARARRAPAPSFDGAPAHVTCPTPSLAGTRARAPASLLSFVGACTRVSASLLSFVGARRDFGAGCLALPVPVPAGTPKTRTGTGIPKHAPAAARAGTGPSKHPRPTSHLACAGAGIPERPVPLAARTPFPPCSLCPSARDAAEEMRPVAMGGGHPPANTRHSSAETALRLPIPHVPRRPSARDGVQTAPALPQLAFPQHPAAALLRRRPTCASPISLTYQP